jgi:hypothetical protein
LLVSPPDAAPPTTLNLGNVNNTLDISKPVSAAQQTALNLKANTSALSLKADLVGGFVPSSQLPSFVDDVLEFAALANFPTTGESGKIYVATGTGITYRWSGTTYVEISASLTLGTTSATAYRGDFGDIAYLHSQIIGNPHGTIINLATNVTGSLPAANGANFVNLTTPQSKAGILTLTDTTISTNSSTGALIVAGGGAFGNITTGSNIRFPATPISSADVNVLDEYKEGTWTPVLTYTTPGTSSITYSRQTGRFQKIGNRVSITFDIRLSSYSKGTASGLLIISGLPYNTRAGGGFDNNYGFLVVANTPFTGIPFLDTGNGFSGGSNYICVFKCITNSVNIALDDPTASALYWGQITYETTN